MSYLGYLNFYAINAGNKGKIAKRGRKNNKWLYSLSVNDKVDIYDKHRSTRGWYIGTIVEIQKEETTLRFKVHYDGWDDKFDEFVNINSNKLASDKLKPFHTFCPYHYYLSVPSANACKWNTRSSKWKRCEICGRKCCVQCFLDATFNQCRDCMLRLEEQSIFKSIYSSIYNQYSIDVHIVYLIVDYSLGFVMQCSNTIKPCYHEINYQSAFEVAKNRVYDMHKRDIQIYSYNPTYFGPGTVKLNGKNTRIFCESCRQKHIRCCSRPNCCMQDCNKNKSGDIICYNHELLSCTICGKVSYESGNDIIDCVCCGEKHCVDCNKAIVPRLGHIRISLTTFSLNTTISTRNAAKPIKYIDVAIALPPKDGLKERDCNINESGDSASICHNHKLVPCTICGKVKDEGVNEICGEKHCADCNIKCEDCKRCAVKVEFVTKDPRICVNEECADCRLNDEYINKCYRNERKCKRERARNGRQKRRNPQEYYHRKYTKRKNLKYHKKLNKMLRCNMSV